jgi:hypothetical protein
VRTDTVVSGCRILERIGTDQAMSTELTMLIAKDIISWMIWLLPVPARVLAISTTCCAGRSAAGIVLLLLILRWRRHGRTSSKTTNEVEVLVMSELTEVETGRYMESEDFWCKESLVSETLWTL